ncbi:hypothetical protein phiPLPE_45 [Iodobacter phage PhiPLPE]|uniref:Phage protein n=1 Tax=Iodobacter phage PhiPLPE TaxID=551895 RepID=B5AX64_9CAUD|nr:hypothetical protein phiPLPE_45 [Iodobacter phage PhiPLPE]ACG60367.1 hypothetical protein phiPLPE_45 [Iodobacter phage PhiPLPE]
MIDSQIEKEIHDKGLVAPRITPADIENSIASEHYFTAADGVKGAFDNENLYCTHADTDTTNGQKLPSCTPYEAHRLLTFCVLVLRNGFTVTGESACASAENFDAEIGRKIARENAINKVWMLEGYLLKQRLSEGV